MDNPNPKKTIPLFNPLSDTFSFEWLDDDNWRHILTMRPLEITYFEPVQADFMARHLVDAIYHQRGQKTNPEDDKKAILREVMV